jgi:ATP/maltotriose-dependent transcriptional regulator MalT
VIAYHSIGMAASCAGQLPVAELLLTRAMAAPAVQDSRRLEIMVRSGIAMLDYCRGQWDHLAAEVDRLLDELVDFPISAVDVAAVAGCLALARGDLDGAGRRLRATMELFQDVGGYGFAPLAAGSIARLALARGEHQAGLPAVREVVRTLRGKGAWAPVCRLLPATVELLLAAGEPAEARELTASAGSALGDRDAPLAPAALAYATGLLAAAGGEPDEAGRWLLLAVERYQRLWCPYEAAQAGEAAARCLFEAADGRAEVTLRSALAGYARLDASWDADRATGLARRHGVAPPSRHGGGRHSYGAALSPREREVAELAAAGRTNKEIGLELYLSPHTVDKHMRAVLRKLGARSRAGVGQRLAMATRPAQASKDGGASP